MTTLTKLLDDFPWQRALTAVGVLLILLTGLVVVARLAIGADFPDGYDTWLYILVGLATASTAGMIGKRATDWKYAQMKASPQVNVEAPSDVTVETHEGG